MEVLCELYLIILLLKYPATKFFFSCDMKNGRGRELERHILFQHYILAWISIDRTQLEWRYVKFKWQREREREREREKWHVGEDALKRRRRSEKFVEPWSRLSSNNDRLRGCIITTLFQRQTTAQKQKLESDWCSSADQTSTRGNTERAKEKENEGSEVKNRGMMSGSDVKLSFDPRSMLLPEKNYYSMALFTHGYLPGNCSWRYTALCNETLWLCRQFHVKIDDCSLQNFLMKTFSLKSIEIGVDKVCYICNVIYKRITYCHSVLRYEIS